MNSKTHAKHRRRAPRLNPKADRGGQHRKIVEAKSNITGKRLTLLPGYLIKGFTSSTAKKAKGRDVNKTKDHLLSENLQAFLEQRGNLRRSQRILKKRNDENTPLSSKSSVNNLCENISKAPINNESPDLRSSGLSIKSILKKNPKSIFKEISDKFSRVQIGNVNEETSLTVPNQLAKHNINDFNDLVACNEVHKIQPSLPPQNQQFGLVCNRFICEGFAKKIRVSFKKNSIQECHEIIKKEINTTNLILEGKIQREEVFSYGAVDSDSETTDIDHMPRIPSKSWVYSTPQNQKLTLPPPDECQLHPAVICVDKNHQNLYEPKIKLKVNFAMDQNKSVPVDNMFFKKLAEVRKTPANFGHKNDAQKIENMFFSKMAEVRKPATSFGPEKAVMFSGVQSMESVFEEPWGGFLGCAVETMNNQQLPFASSTSDMMNCRLSTRMPILAGYLKNDIPSNIIVELPGNTLSNDPIHDFTFVEDGNGFKIQESQAAQRLKRQRSYEDEYTAKRRNFNLETDKCDKPSMFNFNSHESNMFDFGVVL